MEDRDYNDLREAMADFAGYVINNDLFVDCKVELEGDNPYIQIGIIIEDQDNIAIQLPIHRFEYERRVILLNPITLDDK